MAPQIAPLLDVLARAAIDPVVIPAALRTPGAALYAIVGDGEFGGRRYSVGEVVVCRGEPERDEPVMLRPHGPGRPMLGRAHGKQLTGDANEPCSRERWAVAGRVERVLLASAQVVEACARFGRGTRSAARVERAGANLRAFGPAGAGWGPRRPSADAADQLALFGAKAA